MGSVKIHLMNGGTFDAKYADEEYDSIYESWMKGDMMAFENCCVHGDEVMLIEYADACKETVEGTAYEMFRDDSYYDMWCVRNKDDRRFNSPMSFHFEKHADASEFLRLINMAK